MEAAIAINAIFVRLAMDNNDVTCLIQSKSAFRPILQHFVKGR